jgi:DNA helicase-2/ATP-dependent DNA helicase PcrA
MTFEKALEKLNPGQREAVETIEGPVMVVAGPGTGKTQVLALRIANILKKSDVNPENILCLTFTEAGVKAMRERLISFIGTSAYYVAIHTFHSFANEIIQTFPEKFAFSKELRQLDDLNRLKIIQRIIDEMLQSSLEGIAGDDIATESNKNSKLKLIPFYNKYAKTADIISSIQNLKKEAITPDILKQRNEDLKRLIAEQVSPKTGKLTKKIEEKLEKLNAVDELVEIYQKYQNELNETGYYDYEDMIMFVIDKFKEDESLLAYYQEKYLYILVDEYQDTNGSQNQIIKLLGSFDPSPNIFVVGDDDQAIYRFQGANIENILFFGHTFTGVRTIPNLINYRSTQVILNIADSLIEKNTTRLVNQNKNLYKKLKAFKPANNKKAEVWEFENADEENIFIAKEIEKLHSEGTKYSEIAILFRKNAHFEDINEVLNKFNIPTKYEARDSVFDIESVSKLIRLIRLISLKEKNIDELAYEVMLFDFLDLEISDVYRIAKAARKHRVPIIDLIQDENLLEAISLKNKESIQLFINKILNWHKLDSNIAFPKLIERVIAESGLLDFYAEESDEYDNFENLIGINNFFNFVNQQYKSNKELNTRRFLKDLKIIEENRIRVSVQKVNTKKDSVHLLTAHSSKGLEFEYVFVAKASNNNWGGSKRSTSILLPEIFNSEIENISEKDLTIEDERRLFFVAITRAKEKVYFTYANEYENYGIISKTSPSEFIFEINKEYIDFKSSIAKDDKPADIDFNMNDYMIKLKPNKEKAFSLDEEEYLREQIAEFKMTPTCLNIYLESPRRFMLEYLIKLPQTPNKHMAMGIAIHRTLEYLNKNFDKLDTIKLEDLNFIYEKKLRDEFGDDEEFELTLREGLLILDKYFNVNLSALKEFTPVEVEYNFARNNVLLELGDDMDPVQLTGRLDRMELIDNTYLEYSSEIPVRVIDYKTKLPKSKNAIMGLTKDPEGKNMWRQVVFYKLLGDLDRYFRKDRSNKNPRYVVKEVGIDFLVPNKSGKFKREVFEVTDDHVRELKELIKEVVKRIRNLEFPEKSDITI